MALQGHTTQIAHSHNTGHQFDISLRLMKVNKCLQLIQRTRLFGVKFVADFREIDISEAACERPSKRSILREDPMWLNE